ncbi:MAG: ABC transporter substrate-binding protein [Rhodospirillales bacterium 69-11]|nr:MAG: ABC transporter substrate-binding protein [Rhodospirillales bacterium 69-11]
MHTVRIGSGAGYAGDRIEPAVELAERGDIAYLGFECLAERTIALAQQARLADPEGGYDPLLEARMRAVLPACARRRIRIVTNMGAANPIAAARATARIARDLGLAGLKIAAVTGDDVLEAVRDDEHRLLERDGTVADLGERVISANAYLGATPIVAALRGGADVVITGRVADPALFLAPLMHEFGWAEDDWDRMGKGTVVGHLLECAGQITGGYFADPGHKDVAGLARLGFPLAEVAADGSAVITKVPGSGGQVSLASCKEQLLYELHDPTRYLQPDVVADFSSVRLQADGADRVAVSGGSGAQRPDTLKVSVGYLDSFVGEGQISYAGPGALARGRLALDIVRERLALTGVQTTELRFDMIGWDAVHRGPSPEGPEPPEVRIRVAGRTETMAEAVRIGNEVETLYTNGPAGGGGAWKSARQVLAVVSTLIPRGEVTPTLTWETA